MEEKTSHPCANHPETQTRRRCYQCKRYFCARCYFVREHHSFCSEQCFAEYQKSSANVKSTLIPAEKEPEADTPKAEIIESLFRRVSQETPRTQAYWIPPPQPRFGAKRFSLAKFLVPFSVLLLSLAVLGALALSLAWFHKSLARMDEQMEHLAFRQKKMQIHLERVWIALLSEQETRGKGGAKPHRRENASINPHAMAEDGNHFCRGNLDKREIALTFDGGSYTNFCEEILGMLREKGIRCTFFLTGEFIRKFPDWVRQIVQEGHEVGNHTQIHPHLTSYYRNERQETLPDMTAERLSMELKRANEQFFNLCGIHMKPFWRGPYGDYNSQLGQWGREAGYLHVGWTSYGSWLTNLDTNDWVPDEGAAGYRSPEEVIDKILNFGAESPWGANGGIILMHLGSTRKNITQQVHKALGKIIEGMQGKGYRFVTVGELVNGEARYAKQ